MTQHIVSHEERPDQAPAVRSLLASLWDHAPGWPITLALPGMPADLVAAAESKGALITPRPPGISGWDVKPGLLAETLRAGAERAVWVDADVVLAGDPGPALAAGDETLVLSHERPWGGTADLGRRSAAWGLTPRRLMAASVNTAVLSVSQRHLPLLDAWSDALSRPDYRDQQTQAWHTRDPAFHGDQDALTALLCGPYAHVPIKSLVRGPQIVHAIGPRGVTAAERLLTARRGLTFVHGQGPKPWTADRGRHPRRIERLLDVSPYTILTGHPPVTRTGRALRAIAGDHSTLSGLPLAALEDLRTLPSRLTKP